MINRKRSITSLIIFTAIVSLFTGITIGHFIFQYKGFTAHHWFNQQEARKQDIGELLGKQKVQESQIKLFKTCVLQQNDEKTLVNNRIDKKQLDECLTILNIE